MLIYAYIFKLSILWTVKVIMSNFNFQFVLVIQKKRIEHQTQGQCCVGEGAVLQEASATYCNEDRRRRRPVIWTVSHLHLHTICGCVCDREHVCVAHADVDHVCVCVCTCMCALIMKRKTQGRHTAGECVHAHWQMWLYMIKWLLKGDEQVSG